MPQVWGSLHFAAIEDMFANFNLMASELGGIETLRTDFVVAVSHEFKTPLTAIEGYTALLQNGNLSAAQYDECVDKITANVHRLSTLTGTVLQLSKLENQGIVADKKTYSLDKQLRKSILLLEREWSARNIECLIWTCRPYSLTGAKACSIRCGIISYKMPLNSPATAERSA